MKPYSIALEAALDAGEVITVGAVRIGTAEPFCVWGGHADLVLDGEAYVGIGAAGLVQATGGRLGGAESGLELSLSGVDPDTLALLDHADVNRAPVKVWRLMFDLAGVNVLGAFAFARGRVDTMAVEETPGETASIKLRVETAARGLGRSTGRRRADADQRLVSPTDGGMKWLSIAPGRTLVWGGTPPQRLASALPNTSSITKLGQPPQTLRERVWGR